MAEPKRGGFEELLQSFTDVLAGVLLFDDLADGAEPIELVSRRHSSGNGDAMVPEKWHRVPAAQEVIVSDVVRQLAWVAMRPRAVSCVRDGEQILHGVLSREIHEGSHISGELRIATKR